MNRRFPVTILALLLAASVGGPGVAQAADPCSELNLEAPGGSMAGVPIRNQLNLGTCSYYTASLYFDSVRRAANKGKPVDETSSMSLAFDFSDDVMKRVGPESARDQYNNWGAPIDDVVTFAFNHGICREDCFKRKFPDGVPEKIVSDLIVALDEFKDNQWGSLPLEPPKPYRGLEWMDSHYARLRQKIELDHRQSAKAYDHSLRQFSCLAPGSKASPVDSLRMWMKSLPAPQFVEKLRDVQCPESCKSKIDPKLRSALHPRRVLGRVDPNYLESAGDHQLLELIGAMKADQPPVFASLCSRLYFKGPEYDAANRLRLIGDPVVRGQLCGPHAALIVGRRRNSAGKCEVLIRNSWGDDDKTPFHPAFGKWKDRSHLWVPIDVLNRNLVHAVTQEIDHAALEPPKPSRATGGPGNRAQ